MNPNPSSADLRKMSAAQLEALGQESLREHLLAQAVIAHQKHGALGSANLQTFLKDQDCIRHPVRLAFALGPMAMHQFAQPDVDPLNLAQDGRVLYLRPILKQRPELIAVAVAYMVPVINYGDIVSDEQCLLYGAAILGMMEDEYYLAVCALADLCGAETRMPGSGFSSCSPGSNV